MSTAAETLATLLHDQTSHWNAGDKQAFMADYRRVAPEGLSIEYVGRAATDGWPVLDHMWDTQQPKIRVEPVIKIINGNEAACHVRNVIIGSDRAIETIEMFRLEVGKLFVRYFIKT